MSELRRVSYHEAGHIVIGDALGLDTGGAWVERTGRGSATVHTDLDEVLHRWAWRGKFCDYRSAAMASAMVSLAGTVAEEMFIGDLEHDPRMDAVDRQRAASLAARYDLDLDRLRRDVRLLLHQNRGKVRRVAVSLRARRTLDAAAIDELTIPFLRIKEV